MNDNDLAIVVTAVLLATGFIALFAWRSPVQFGAWALRRLAPGVAILAGLTVLASWWVHGIAETNAADCEVLAAKYLAYDCEDAFLAVAMAVLTGAFAVILFVLGLFGHYAVRRIFRAGVA